MSRWKQLDRSFLFAIFCILVVSLPLTQTLKTKVVQERLCGKNSRMVFPKNAGKRFKNPCPHSCRHNSTRKYTKLTRKDLGWINIDRCSLCRVFGIRPFCAEFYCRVRRICHILLFKTPGSWTQ